MTNGSHHGSHLDLIDQPERSITTSETVDAIIVPSARTAPYLRTAAGIARDLRCPLVVLCSRRARAAEIAKDLRDNGFVVDLVAVDVSEDFRLKLPHMKTTSLLAGKQFARRTDTSRKRNVGLAVTRMMRWQRIVFLDDDIAVPDPTDLRRAVTLLDDHDGVGLRIGGYPDNSVVCHAHREAGGWQETFVGGGALAVAADRVDSFFPEIYNEDWFFLLNEDGLRSVALTGTALQRPYDPVATPDRARAEEFGDCLAEGIFAILDDKGKIGDATKAYWKGFLAQRRSLIDDIIRRTEARELDPREKRRVVEALKGARGRLHFITPEQCVRYLQAWQHDRTTWTEHLRTLQKTESIQHAMHCLGLDGQGVVRRNRSSLRASERPVKTAPKPDQPTGARCPASPSRAPANTTTAAARNGSVNSAEPRPTRCANSPINGGATRLAL